MDQSTIGDANAVVNANAKAKAKANAASRKSAAMNERATKGEGKREMANARVADARECAARCAEMVARLDS